MSGVTNVVNCRSRSTKQALLVPVPGLLPNEIGIENQSEIFVNSVDSWFDRWVGLHIFSLGRSCLFVFLVATLSSQRHATAGADQKTVN